MNFVSDLPKAGLKAGDSIHSTGSQSSPHHGLGSAPGVDGQPGHHISQQDSPLCKSDWWRKRKGEQRNMAVKIKKLTVELHGQHFFFFPQLLGLVC